MLSAEGFAKIARGVSMKVLVIISADDAQLGQATAVVEIWPCDNEDDVFYEWLLGENPYWHGKPREDALGAPYAWNVVDVLRRE